MMLWPLIAVGTAKVTAPMTNLLTIRFWSSLTKYLMRMRTKQHQSGVISAMVHVIVILSPIPDRNLSIGHEQSGVA